MKDYIKLLMGIISGFALILLNTDLVHGTITNILMIFETTKLGVIFLNFSMLMSRVCVMLAFIGIWVVIICAILIIKKVIFTKDK